MSHEIGGLLFFRFYTCFFCLFSAFFVTLPKVVNFKYSIHFTMYEVCQILKEIRVQRGLSLRSVHAFSGIHLAQLSRIENGKRLPTLEQIQILAKIYDCDEKHLIIQRESDRILDSIPFPEIKKETLKVAEEKIVYGSQYMTVFSDRLIEQKIGLESRRYIGNKARLTDWIMEIIKVHTSCAGTFCDIFAGSASVAKKAIPFFDNVIINDFLFSNNIIYQGFFGRGKWSTEKISEIIAAYNAVEIDFLPENYFSISFGGKFFEHKLAKLIGYIREDIESMRPTLTNKEYAILLASLIYSIDKHANTVGHFDAYIKKEIPERAFRLKMIDAQNIPNVKIFREDSNTLARNISCDVAYIDPPYNSRQYCRFYHLYENLVKWEKPALYGVALKPTPENMSGFCTSKAPLYFEDLIANLNAKYFVVSYNNTYQSKSKSSANKIKLEQILDILNKCGDTQVFEHSYNAFNTGKTEFADHKELLFVTKVDNERKSKAFASILCR